MLPGGQYARGQVLLLPRIGRIHVLCLLEAKQKPNKPLGEDGGRCPAVMLPLWSYKSELLTPKPKAYHHLHYNEGHHPRQGDKQEKTVLPCMWQSSNTIRAGQMPHIALRCLEGSTMSNLVHRRRRCARIVPYMILCLKSCANERRSKLA